MEEIKKLSKWDSEVFNNKYNILAVTAKVIITDRDKRSKGISCIKKE
jgi:hypothetical protein